jgi:serine-type D-Ala-D-Ala carboxypeptidase/endopeptidase
MPAKPPSAARRRTIRRLGLAAAAPTWAAAAQAAEPPPRPDARPVLRERLAVQGVGLLAVQVDGAHVRLTPAGRARTGGDPLREDALFEIGSITKTFTALLLADAVVQRRLALDGAVEEALPDQRLRDSTGEPIRWIDLATHRSGLPRLPDNLAPADPADPYADYGEDRLNDFLRRFRATRPRDSRWEYSNLGYGLLGHALARAAGSTYDALLRERVLKPLALNSAVLAGPGSAPAGLVDGHAADGKPVPHWRFGVLAPCGALLMSGADLGRYAQAALGVIDHPLREAFALTQREHAAGPSAINPIGLAWLRAPLNGRTVLNHDGGTFGFSASLWLDPANRRAAAVLANAMVEVNDLALHLIEPAVPPKDLRATQQPAIPVDPQDLAPLAGTYALRPEMAITVRVREGRLFAQATGQGEFELFAKAPRRFFARITPLEIEFDAGPTPAALTLRQAGQVLRFERRP